MVLIGYNGIIDKPGSGIAEIGVSLDYRLLARHPRRDRIAVRGALRSLEAGGGAQAKTARPPSAAGNGREGSVISQDVRSGDASRIATWRSSWSGSPRRRRSPPRAGWDAATRRPPTRPRSTRCGCCFDTVPMDGIVVIGEGEKDEAPMLYNGEQIGDGSPPVVDIAVDPLEGTDPTARGMPGGARGDRALPSAGPCSTPAPASIWRSSPAARRSPTCLSLDEPLGRSDREGRRAQGRRAGDVTGDHARPPAPRGAGRGDPRGRRPHPLHQRRRRLRALCWRSPRAPASTCSGASAAPRGGAVGGRDQVPRRAAAGQALAARRRASARRRSTPATTSTRSSTPTASSAATTSSSRRPGSPTATCSTASATSTMATPRPSRW